LPRGTFTEGLDQTEARVMGSQVQVNIKGDATADILITLTNAAQLTADSFLFI
jgi:hypothetical protein